MSVASNSQMLKRISAYILFFFLLAPRVLSQQGTGSIKGIVSDQLGGLVVAATVIATAVCVTRNLRRSVHACLLISFQIFIYLISGKLTRNRSGEKTFLRQTNSSAEPIIIRPMHNPIQTPSAPQPRRKHRKYPRGIPINQ